MDLGPLVCVVLQMRHQLLDPVLPAHGDPRLDGVADGVGGLDLGGGHQGDLGDVPSGPLGGFLHGFPHRCHVGGNALIALGFWHH